MKTPTYSHSINLDFASTLRHRVNIYFSTHNLSKKANHHMVIKTITALAIYLLPYLYMVLSPSDNVALLFLLWALMGVGITLIGTSVMHDSLHGSYAHRPWINRLIGLCTWLIGVNASTWKIQHNLLHHTFPNVDQVDEDIEPKFLFRFSPNQPRRWFHRYQHVYAIIFYSLSTFQWVTAKDFVKAVKYLKEGLVKPDGQFQMLMAKIILGRILYFSVFLLIPILLLPLPVYLVLFMFLVMHLVSGLMLSFIFQCAHVMPSSKFVDQDTNVIEENRLVHQLNTTTNFGMNSSLLFWFSGGLNHQIEHHLFTDICHVHYHSLSRIVRATALEFDLPYHNQSTFGKAVVSHLKMLRNLGTGRI